MRTKDFAKAHPVCGWCKVTARSGLPALRFGRLDLPASVDNREYCTAVEDQGAKPWCAAYTAAAFAENVLWRRDGRITQIEPEPVYKWAKAHDGEADTPGTNLVCVLDALLSRKVFDKGVCKARMVGKDEQDVKSAIHRFGCVLGAFNITGEWYDLAKPGVVSVTGKRHNDQIGGHAVLVCGYTPVGVWVENSWGSGWGERGFGLVEWAAFRSQWLYGTVLTNCLNGFK